MIHVVMLIPVVIGSLFVGGWIGWNLGVADHVMNNVPALGVGVQCPTCQEIHELGSLHVVWS